MVNYNKLFTLLEKKGISSYVIRQKGLLPQSTLQKFRVCSGTDKEIADKLEDYKQKNKKDFKADVSTKTIEDICQLLQCQPQDIMDWKVELKPELSYESRFLDKSDN
ncbi:helix-turn-helix transcriptional regulator [Lachnospiraceae bacterium 29-84]